jgi:hypothetical protein
MDIGTQKIVDCLLEIGGKVRDVENQERLFFFVLGFEHYQSEPVGAILRHLVRK